MSAPPWIHEGGTSVLVGTADAACVPACCRGIAIRIAPDLGRTTAFVPVATSGAVIANAAATLRAAFVVTRPAEHFSVQLKGRVETIRLAADAEQPFVRSRLMEFAEVIDALGMPRRLGETLSYWPAFAIELAVEDVFDQTPGPRAGTVLR